MVGSLVRCELEGGVAKITLSRASVGNAMDMAFMDALYDAVSATTGSGHTRAILLKGEGKNFCVGGDIRDLAAATDTSGHLARLAARLHQSVQMLAECRAPVIAAVQGAAAGAGLSLVAAADLAIAARSARFTMAYAGIGLTADGGATWLLPRVIGLRRAQELAFTGRTLSAEEAEKYGLITSIVDDAALDIEANELASRVANGPTEAFGRIKELLAAQAKMTFSEQLDAELKAITEVRSTADAQEGIAAFLARRPPHFVGH